MSGLIFGGGWKKYGSPKNLLDGCKTITWIVWKALYESNLRLALFREWCRLRQTINLPIADHIGGTNLITAFQARTLDYAIIGSASHVETINQSYLAHQLGMGGWSQTVAYGPGAAIGLHVAACMPNLTQPYDMVGPMAWEDTLVNEDFPFENGCFLVPDRPGLGYTLNHEATKQYLIQKHVLE